MFSNRMTTRELFANSSSEKHEYSECSDSFSQLQNSQYDFTQYSQDLGNSQQQSSGSDSQGRKIFEKYMAGGQFNKQNQPKSGQTLPGSQKLAGNISSNNRPTNTRPSFQQQLQVNKIRAKEKDERDLLNSIVSIVKDCSSEVKTALRNMKDDLGQVMDNSDDKLSTAVNTVSDIVGESYAKMLQAVKERDEKISKVTEMEKEICSRDTKISELQHELSNFQKQKENQTINALKQVLDHHQSDTELKLQHLVDIAKEQLENQRQIISTQDQNKKETVQMHKQFQKENLQKYENTEKRVLDEVIQLRDDLEKHKNELADFYRNQMKSLRLNQSTEIQQHIRSGLEKSIEISYEQSKELWNLQYNQLNDLCKTQQTEIECYIRTQVAEQTRFQQHQYEKQIEKQKTQLEKQGELIKDQITAEIKSDQTIKKWDFHKSIPKNVQEELDTMHRNYMKEIEKLRKEISSESADKAEICTVNRKSFVTDSSDYGKMAKSVQGDQFGCISSSNGFNQSNVYQEESKKLQNRGTSFSFKNNTNPSSIISPSFRSNGWNSKMLFSKTNPSPVATVKPQPQESTSNSKIATHDHDDDESQMEDIRRQQQTPGTGHLRRSQRLSSGKTDSQTENVSSQSQEFRNPTLKKSQNNNFEKNTYKGKQNNLLQVNSNFRHQFGFKKSDTDTSSVFISTSQIKPLMEKSYDRSFDKVAKSGVEAVRQKYDSSCQNPVTGRQRQGVASASVFDFDKENSPASRLMTKPFQVYKSKQNRQSTNWKSTTNKDSRKRNPVWGGYENSCSRDSSPSMSITQIFIKSKNRHPKEVPASPVSSDSDESNLYSSTAYRSNAHGHTKDCDDFLSTPNLEDTSQSVYNWDSQVEETKINRSGQKRRLFFNELNSQMAEVISTVKSQQKKRRF